MYFREHRTLTVVEDYDVVIVVEQNVVVKEDVIKWEKMSYCSGIACSSGRDRNVVVKDNGIKCSNVRCSGIFLMEYIVL